MEMYRSQIEEIGKRIATELHLAVYDIEEMTTVKGRVIVVYLTKIGGINLDECASFSRKLSEVLDESELIPDKYFLEVSSPGIERPLRLKMHYMSAINELVEIQWDQDGERLTSQGILLEVSPDNIVIKENEEPLEIPFSAIHKARTCFSDGRKKGKK